MISNSQSGGPEKIGERGEKRVGGGGIKDLWTLIAKSYERIIHKKDGKRDMIRTKKKH